MYNAYGLTLTLPDPSGTESPQTNKADVKIKSSLKPLYNLHNIQWLTNINEEDYIFFGKRKDGYYIADFHTESTVFAINNKGSEIIFYTTKKNNFYEIRHLVLNHVIPLVLNLKGIETIHASSILTQNGVVGFVGESGFGKSTIAAWLINYGQTLLSDDALPILLEPEGICTISGPPEINLRYHLLSNLKVFNSVICKFPHKACFALNKKQHVEGKFPLKNIYFLKPDEKIRHIKINEMKKTEALVCLLKQTYRLDIEDKLMLKRQLHTLEKIVNNIPAKVLFYPKAMPDPEKICLLLLKDIGVNFESKLTA